MKDLREGWIILKKIFISTLHFYNNFGSVLQAYALRRVLQREGYRAEVVPYRPELPEYQYFQEKSLQVAYQEKCNKFECFREKYLGVSETLKNRTEIEEKWRDCDIAIVGSDIVWGQEFSGLDSLYFLEPFRKDCKRISYAASVILDQNGNTEDDEIFARYLPMFNRVSVRETSAIQNIQRFTPKKVEAVLDPTLLLDAEDYEELVIENEQMKNRPYLLSYFLTHDPAVVDYTNLMAKKLGLRVIHYFADYPDRVFPADAECFAFAGPGEFLGYVKNAECIFTNSFHGTCFSIIYQKPFYTYMAERTMLSRVRDMADRLGLEEHLFTDFRDWDKVTGQIDSTGYRKKLLAEREKSLYFLRISIK